MNNFIKVVLAGCAIVLAFVLNTMLFEMIFKPDFEYLKNIWWSILFSFAATASQLALLRMAMGKLRVQLVWDSAIEDSRT